MDWVLLTDGEWSGVFRRGIVDTKHGRADLRRARPGKVVKTSKGKELKVIEATPRDLFRLMRRGPQVVIPEIMGIVASRTFIGRDWRIVEAGGGSGYATLFLSSFSPDGKVYVYEKNGRHFRILRENVKKLGLSNVVLRNRDVAEMREKRLDMVFLDMKGPEKVLGKALEAVKPGRFVVVYSPQIEQVIDVRREAERIGGAECETMEAIIRKWKVDTRGYTHPEYSGLMHTGFLTFIRKL